MIKCAVCSDVTDGDPDGAAATLTTAPRKQLLPFCGNRRRRRGKEGEGEGERGEE